jgi:hypothetical protein
MDDRRWTIAMAHGPRAGYNLRVVDRIIVRRGRFVTYEQLRRTFGDDPNVEIIWDRRRPVDLVSDDAGVPGTERRGQLPAEFQQLDYFFTSGKRAGAPDTEPPAS